MKQTLLVILGLICMNAAAQSVNTYIGQAGSPSGAVSTTPLSGALLNEPYGIVFDAAGNLYISEQGAHRIRMYNPADGNMYTRAGATNDPSGGLNANYLNNPGTTSRFNTPMGMDVDAAGNVYIADNQNHCIRKLDKFVSVGSSQLTSTVAGEGPSPSAGTGDYVNAQGTNARFNSPMDVAVDAAGNIYVADAFNDCIRKIDPAGNVTLVAGTPTDSPTFGFADGAAATAKFDLPVGVELESATSLLVADAGNRRIRRIDLVNGTVSTVAGNGNQSGKDGAVGVAEFSSPTGLAIDAFGNIFVADGRSGQANTIRKISNGQVTTIAGKYNEPGTANGPGNTARFNVPYQLAFNSTKDVLYATDGQNHTVRAINLKPVADFSTSITNINVNVEITMNNTSLGATGYFWEITPNTGVTFEQGTTSGSASPKLKFAQSGTYTVKLTVTNEYGNDIKTRSNYITVTSSGGGNSPIADFTANRTNVSINDTVSFADLSTNTPNQWDWVFTPSNVQYVAGTTASSQHPKVKFTQNGVYNVSLTATNTIGANTKTKTGYISVSPAGIKDITLDDLVNVYPNPTSGRLYIDLARIPVSSTLTVAVFDMTGKAVYNNILFENRSTIELNLDGYNKGVYFVTVYDGYNKVNKTVVVQ